MIMWDVEDFMIALADMKFSIIFVAYALAPSPMAKLASIQGTRQVTDGLISS